MKKRRNSQKSQKPTVKSKRTQERVPIVGLRGKGIGIALVRFGKIAGSSSVPAPRH